MALASLIKISPLVISGGVRVDAYASSMDDASVLGLNGVVWEPAIVGAPTLTMTLWEGDFTSSVQAGSASFSLKMNVLTKTYAVDGAMWVGAPVEIYAETPGTAWPWTLRFKGKVSSFSRRDQTLSLTAEVDNEPFAANVLTATYAGIGGAEGSSNLKDKVKPLVLGYASNVEPILIDEVNSVYQFSGYGAIEGVATLYERGSDFGAPVGDYATYTALVAATIPAGRWATCLASGMVRLGAPAAGVITGDVRGHRVGANTPRFTGAIITALSTIAGVGSTLLNAASLTAIDTAIPYPINLVLTDQVSFLDIATDLARCCNWQAGVSLTGVFFVSQIDFSGAEVLTLNALGTTLPQVVRSDELDTSVPYYRTVMGAARSWRVHTSDEIAYYFTVEEKGLYSSATTYKGGQVVSLADQSRWIYTNNTPSAGNAPPTWPTTSNAWWSNLSGPAAYGSLTGKPTALADINSSEGSKLTGIEAGATSGQNRVFNGNAENGNIGWVEVEASASGPRSISVSAAAASNGSLGFVITKNAVADGTGFGGRAIALLPGRTYIFRVTLRGSSATATGLYLRMNEKTSAPADGVTVNVTDRTSFFDLVSNGAIPSTQTTYEFQYTPSSGVLFASPAIYNWGGGPTQLYFDDCQVFETTNWKTGIVGAGKPADSATRNEAGANMLESPVLLDTGFAATAGAVLEVTGATGPARDRYRLRLDNNNALYWLQGNTKIALVPGEKIWLRASLFAGTGTSGQCQFGLQCEDIAGTFISNIAGPVLSAGSSGWFSLEVSAVVPANVAFAKPYFQRFGGTNGGSFYLAEPSISRQQLGADITGSNTAAAITGQGALATKNAVDLSTADATAFGSTPVSVPSGGFTYTASASTTSATISWSAFTIYRADLSTISVSAGSQTITGLNPGSTYKVYPYVVDSGGSSGTVAFVSGGVTGSPAIVFASGGNPLAAATMNQRGNIPLGGFNVAVPSSGSTGGSGGGSNCLHPMMEVDGMLAGDLCAGDYLGSPDGPVPVLEVARRICSEWFVLSNGPHEIARVTRGHIFYRATGEPVRAEDIRLGDLLAAAGDHVEVTGLALDRTAAVLVGLGLPEPHLHFGGPMNLLMHNGTAKP